MSVQITDDEGNQIGEIKTTAIVQGINGEELILDGVVLGREFTAGIPLKTQHRLVTDAAPTAGG